MDLPVDVNARIQIAEAMLGEIGDDVNGGRNCKCPGAHLHTSGYKERGTKLTAECRVYLEKGERNAAGIPTIKCMHSSCSVAVDEANRSLRSQIAKHEWAKAKGEGFHPPKQRHRTKEEIEREWKERRNAALRVRSRDSVAEIVRAYPWSSYEMWEASTGELKNGRILTPRVQIELMLGLFEPDEIIWCGDFKTRVFAPASVWLKQAVESAIVPGPRICPNVFREGATARSNEQMKRLKFFVLEHDKLSLSEQSALIRWMSEKVGWTLRAVVYTGGKSLHAWFDAPAAAELEEARVVLGAMGFDPSSFTASQPYRLPGWNHDKTGHQAKILFYGGK